MSGHLYEYRVTLVVAYLGLVDLYFDVPLSAGFYLGRWEFSITDWAGEQDDLISESKSTQLR